MADLSINTSQINPSVAADTVLKNAEVKEESAKEVKAEDNGLITSTAIENSKVEADVLTKNTEEKAEKETPLITEEMINNIAAQVDQVISSPKANPVVPDKSVPADITTVPDLIKKAAEQAKNTMEGKTKPKSMAEFVQQRKEEKAQKKAEKQAKAEQKVQAENSKLAKKAQMSKKSKGKSSEITVKIVKDENGKWKAEKPKTPEFNARNTYMRSAKQDYIEKNPEPAFSAEDTSEKNESVEHSKWQTDYNKHMQMQEKNYQADHKDYQSQYFAYKKAQLKAQQMNK